MQPRPYRILEALLLPYDIPPAIANIMQIGLEGNEGSVGW